VFNNGTQVAEAGQSSKQTHNHVSGHSNNSLNFEKIDRYNANIPMLIVGTKLDLHCSSSKSIQRSLSLSRRAITHAPRAQFIGSSIVKDFDTHRDYGVCAVFVSTLESFNSSSFINDLDVQTTLDPQPVAIGSGCWKRVMSNVCGSFHFFGQYFGHCCRYWRKITGKSEYQSDEGLPLDMHQSAEYGTTGREIAAKLSNTRYVCFEFHHSEVYWQLFFIY
jgi:hypothetical protein